jgi:hypothetical protein
MSDSGTEFRMDPATDPRTIITPDAFQVAPELLGLSLARPWRRAAAILVDLTLVAILANAQAVFFAFAFGVFVFWLAVKRRQKGDPPSCARRAARGGLGCMGATTLTVVVLVTWFSATTDPDAPLLTSVGVPVSLNNLRDIATVARGGDSAEVALAARRVMERLLAEGAEPEDIRREVAELADLSPVARAVAEDMIAGIEPNEQPATAEPLDLDALLTEYAAARSVGDSVEMDRLGPVLGSELATEELAARDEQIAELNSSNREFESQVTQGQIALEAEQNKGILNKVIGLLDELGLGLGWSGLYFTFFLGFWRGRTPGKWLLRIRVVRLDGRPLGYWVSFERFGGYAASLFTGLEGFARILWDRNRQALEDKLAETVVIVDTADAKRRVADLHQRAGGRPSARRPRSERSEDAKSSAA